MRVASTTLESAARTWVDTVHETFEEALVLTRAFAIVPFGALPEPERMHATKLAGAAEEVLAEDAPVLVLMATRGTLGAWNDRARSENHLAIPIVSAALVQSAPMLGALLTDLASVQAETPTAPTFDYDSVATSRLETFYVFDARTTIDDRQRLKIPSRDFVVDHDVQTVFGVGGNYGTGSLFAMVLFARQHVSRDVADQLRPAAWDFMGSTLDAVKRGDFFSR